MSKPNTNTQKSNVSRRDFFDKSGKVVAVSTVAALAGPAINVLGQNETLKLGIIGSGKRGRYLMTQAMTMSQREDVPLEFIADADTFDGWRDAGVELAERIADKCTGYSNHKEMLEKEKLDGVIVAVPEHLHAEIAIDVVNAGLDIYLEKPMVHTIEQGKKLVKAVEGSNVIMQVGTQRRSVPLFYEARKLIKDGAIGDVTYCEGWWNRNFRSNTPNRAWLYEIPEDANEQNCNWKAFLGDTPYVPFDLKRYFQWRCYWEYSNGIGSDLMIHQVDAINCVMDTTMPTSVMASGGIYRWKDARTTPDTWTAVMEYPEGFQLNYHARFSNTTDNSKQYGIKMCGTQGTIEIDLYHKLTLTPEEQWLREIDVEPYENTYCRAANVANDQGVRDHIKNWTDCIKSREKPNCDVRTGFYGAAISHMSIMSYQQGKRVNWDAEKEDAYM